MKQTLAVPTYLAVTDALTSAGATLTAAEAHGLMCGLICASPYTNAPVWEPLLPNLNKCRASQKILQQLYVHSTTQISEFALEFALLLPDDTSDINSRTEQLGLWCQGFLVGLRHGPLQLPIAHSTHYSARPEEHENVHEAASALQDLAEIAQVSYGDIKASDAEETALFELIEYVRLATLMLYHELRTPALDNHPDDDLPLH